MKKWMKQYYDLVMLWVQIFVDYVTITGTLYFSYWLWIHSNEIRHNSNPQFLSLEIYLLIGLLFLFIFKVTGAYENDMSVVHVKEVRSVLRGIIWGYGILIAVSFFLQSVTLSRLQSIYAIGILASLIGIERYLLHQLNKFLHKKGIGTKRILIYGAGDTGKRLSKHLNSAPKLGYKVIGYVDDQKFKSPATTQMDAYDAMILGRLEHVKDLTMKYQVDEMFITMPSASSERISQIVQTCNGSLPRYRFVPSMSDLHLQQVQLESINGIPLCAIKEHKHSPFQEYLKRGFDLLFSVFILLLMSPIMAVIALKIKHDSEGSIFFKQQRVGKNGKLFTMYKFRTMYSNVLPYAITPQAKTDPRITRFGRFLRKTSLDELPQFWNVLKGEMSVVGPRPEMQFIVNNYNEVQRQRLKVKPGITGLWQISSDRSKPIHEALEHDLAYIENQSILLDFIIVWETIFFGLRGI